MKQNVINACGWISMIPWAAVAHLIWLPFMGGATTTLVVIQLVLLLVQVVAFIVAYRNDVY